MIHHHHGTHCRVQDCPYAYKPYYNSEKGSPYMLFLSLKGGDGELCRHTQFSSFPPAVTLNTVEKLTDERLSCFYVVVRALRDHYRMKHMRSNDDGYPDFLVNIKTIPSSNQKKSNDFLWWTTAK